jgi:hypothetical protein
MTWQPARDLSDARIHTRGTRPTFETLEHGGEQPNVMPQAIRPADAERCSCVDVQNWPVADKQSKRFRALENSRG